MIGSIFKVIAALIAGLFIGLMLGILLGMMLGFGPSFFFREIVYAGQTVLMSIILALMLGSLLASFACLLLNKIFETHDNLSIGGAIGAGIGFIVVVFLHGMIYIPDPAMFREAFYAGVLEYSVSIGGQIGAIIYPLFAAVAVIRDKIRSARELRENQKREEERKYGISVY